MGWHSNLESVCLFRYRIWFYLLQAFEFCTPLFSLKTVWNSATFRFEYCSIQSITDWRSLGPESFTPCALALPCGRITRERESTWGLPCFPYLTTNQCGSYLCAGGNYCLRTVGLALRQSFHIPFWSWCVQPLSPNQKMTSFR